MGSPILGMNIAWLLKLEEEQRQQQPVGPSKPKEAAKEKKAGTRSKAMSGMNTAWVQELEEEQRQQQP
eukprot:6732634-Prorocentrum_lima.AAC.1